MSTDIAQGMDLSCIHSEGNSGAKTAWGLAFLPRTTSCRPAEVTRFTSKSDSPCLKYRSHKILPTGWSDGQKLYLVHCRASSRTYHCPYSNKIVSSFSWDSDRWFKVVILPYTTNFEDGVNYIFVLISTSYKTWWESILWYWLLRDIALISFCNYKKKKNPRN
jgi:hypothetical protein